MLRRVVTLAVAVLLAAGCVVAGLWQWSRHEDRSRTADLVSSNYDAEPVAVADVLAAGAPLEPDDTWRPVTAVGRYTDDRVVLRGRPVDGSPAVHDLAVLEVTQGPLTGTLLVVNRGWAALAPDAGLPPAPPLPAGEVTVVMRLRPLEGGSDRSAPAGETFAVAPADLVRAGVPQDVLGAYGVLVTEDGAPPPGLAALPRPGTSTGVNLSYAFQWWVFALGALVGGVLLIRRTDDDDVRDASPTGTTSGQGDAREDGDVRNQGAPRRTPRSRRPTAEDEEDAIVDAQEGAARDRRAGR